jgi:glycine/D-amino acid oxidase-like deaminating enzyme
MTLRLLEAARSRRMRTYEQTLVVEVEADPSRVVVRTQRGPVVRAERVVFASGYETVPSLRKWAEAKLSSTYAVATAPLSSLAGWEDRCVIWETARPYFYARTTMDGRAIVGGEDEETADPRARDALIPEKARRLIARLNDMFPALKAEGRYAWAGTFGESPDGLAYIGTPPGLARVMLAVGLGGNGMTFAMIAARIVEAWCAGREWPGARLFALKGRDR